MQTPRLKISPPWVTYMNKLQALFDGDPQLAFNIDYENMTVALAGNNGEKNAALQRLLPTEKKFGNITLKIIVDGPIANIAFPTQKDLFDTAFAGNPAYAYSVSPADEGYWFFSMTYVVFKNHVVQFFNDNLNDCHGLISTLYQDIAAEIFEDAELSNVYYNTDIENKLGKPLGEWP